MSNSLIHESSPYLLQHADNPVQWHTWNENALKKARDENKPIFLSIGYSSCHWCHVMAHESFEDSNIAKIMNENFVNIKVDREERPDIDDIYQKACQIATGQGGWPLSVFLTPDQRPFYVGTYFPIMDSYGRPGFGSILLQLAQAWKEKPNDIKKKAASFLDTLQKTDEKNIIPNITTSSTPKINNSILNEAAVNLLHLSDDNYGGFGSAPKFPNAASISFMFRYSKSSKISKFQEFALKTLKKMAKGGIFDQIGGGFHRYSTDARWLVPHFEKMLYDNALIPINYIEAYQITKDPFYLEVLKKTLDFVLRDLTSPQGGFYSALDADSQGEEGKFYTWSKSEIQQILKKEDADIFCLFYDVTDGGNWEGKTILCNNINMSAVSFHSGKSEQQVKQILEQSAKKLLDIRSKRVWPSLDDKILTAWNALMITAFAKGYRVTHDQKYLDAAKKCTDFILENLCKEDNTLLHTSKDGNSKIQGYLEDYAYFASSLLDLFEIEPQQKYLKKSIKLGEYLLDHFWDPQSNSFFMTADNHEKLIIRPKSNYDLSIPSGNSVAANLLLRLYHFTQNKQFLDISTKIMNSQAQMAAEHPFGFGHLLNTLYMFVQKPMEITVLVDGDVNNSKLNQFIAEKFLPEALFVTIPDKSLLEDLLEYSFFTGKEFPTSTTQNPSLAFICKDFTCSLPLNTINQVESELSKYP
jgi:uncharacterized protein YyaL (SSP411 family)